MPNSSPARSPSTDCSYQNSRTRQASSAARLLGACTVPEALPGSSPCVPRPRKNSVPPRRPASASVSAVIASSNRFETVSRPSTPPRALANTSMVFAASISTPCCSSSVRRPAQSPASASSNGCSAVAWAAIRMQPATKANRHEIETTRFIVPPVEHGVGRSQRPERAFEWECDVFATILRPQKPLFDLAQITIVFICDNVTIARPDLPAAPAATRNPAATAWNGRRLDRQQGRPGWPPTGHSEARQRDATDPQAAFHRRDRSRGRLWAGQQGVSSETAVAGPDPGHRTDRDAVCADGRPGRDPGSRVFSQSSQGRGRKPPRRTNRTSGQIMSERYVVGVVGNPNCGKTTLFNALTGAKQRVGNWPGVTVERKVGRYIFQGVEFELVDLPGTYSLEVSEDDISIDEAIARDYVAGREADLVVNIVDASNLERNLYLTSQLLEMKVPMVVALNMMDVAGERGIEIDAAALSQRLGCPVVPVVAASGQGLAELKRVILESARAELRPTTGVPYPAAVEKAVASLLPCIGDAARAGGADPRWLAVQLLEGDSLARRMVGPEFDQDLEALQQETEKALGDDIDISLADARYGFINEITRGAVKRTREVGRSLSDRIDRVVLNRMLGIPIFLFAMHLMFMFTINIGGAFIDAFDIVSGAIFVDGLAQLLDNIGAPGWLIVLLADGAGGGIQVVATFIPIVAFLFLFLSILEDSGYMARAAFVMDRFLRSIGLPGKSFVPMIVGFGCTVPAVMATRTLENERDRLMTT